MKQNNYWNNQEFYKSEIFYANTEDNHNNDCTYILKNFEEPEIEKLVTKSNVINTKSLIKIT